MREENMWKNDGFKDERYPGWDIQVIEPDPAGFDDEDITSKMTEINITMLPGDLQDRVNRYPWHYLEDKNNYLILKNVNAKVARMKAYAYAHRRGWKIWSRVIDDKTAKMYRYY